MSRRSTLIAVLVLLVVYFAIQYLQTPAKPTIFAELPFEQAQSQAEQAAPARLLVVDFSASWCGPCRQMDRSTWTSPALTDWLKDHAVTIKVDVDAEKARARALGISEIPTVVVMRGRKESARFTGLMKPGELLDRLKAIAAEPPTR